MKTFAQLYGLGLLFCQLSTLLCSSVRSDNMTFVQVAQGVLRGTEEHLPSGETFYSFKGIPYAQPPVGELRFKKPEPPMPWEGIRDASKHGAACPQFPEPLVGSTENTSEDCLFLNVYTRNTTPDTKKPVMLWIHGGAFFVGSGDTKVYGPKYLVERDVVLVTINYRLEALGFLCLDTPEVPGNAAMKDQVAAMKWVKDNIANFGGDPEKITIFGESAGGASVALQLVSPLAKGLFSKAIMQSGSSIADWSHATNGKEIAIQLAKFLGKETEDEKELLKFLQSVPASDLVGITGRYKAQDPLLRLIFVPVIEKRFQGVPAFLEKEPIEYLTAGDVPDVPIIIGVTSGEGILFLLEDTQKTELLNKQPDLGVFRELKKGRSLNEISNIGKQIHRSFFGEKPISGETVTELVNFNSDYLFVYPAYRLCNLLAQRNKSPVYLYYYSFVNNEDILNKLTKGPFADQLPLASHGSELSSLFNRGSSQPPEQNTPQAVIINNMATLWTDFAKTGTPTPDEKLWISWERYSPNEKNYLQIDVPLSTGKNFLTERMETWNELYKRNSLPV